MIGNTRAETIALTLSKQHPFLEAGVPGFRVTVVM